MRNIWKKSKIGPKQISSHFSGSQIPEKVENRSDKISSHFSGSRIPEKSKIGPKQISSHFSGSQIPEKVKNRPPKNSAHFSVLAKNITSQKYGQIVPTPCGSILHHTKPSQKPYNAKNRFLAISSNICIIHIIPIDGW